MTPFGQPDEAIKVALIIDNDTIAVTGGAVGGMQRGDRLALLLAPLVVYDPDTHELLGEIQRVAATFEVFRVEQRSALCRLEGRIARCELKVGLVLRRRDRLTDKIE